MRWKQLLKNMSGKIDDNKIMEQMQFMKSDNMSSILPELQRIALIVTYDMGWKKEQVVKYTIL